MQRCGSASSTTRRPKASCSYAGSTRRGSGSRTRTSRGGPTPSKAVLPHLARRDSCSTRRRTDMSMLQFDEDAARHLLRLYSTPDVVQQRAEVLTLIAAQPGERVLDI